MVKIVDQSNPREIKKLELKVPHSIEEIYIDLSSGIYLGVKEIRIKISNIKNTPTIKEENLTVFISYSHEDESFRKDLEKHLKILKRSGVIKVWNDRKIMPGLDWDNEISNNIEGADVILLLISPDFIASDYCWGKEVKTAIEKHNCQESIVIPISLRPSSISKTPIGKIQGLPKDMKPITLWENRDLAWTHIVDNLESLFLDLSKKGEKAVY